jgi:hypothetical protein
MKLLTATSDLPETNAGSVETIAISQAHLDFLRAVSERINPNMPAAFGRAHVLRTLLERLEEAELNLSDASSEEELAEIAAAGLRRTTR